MFRDALYYPHILLPQGDWLTKAILFWESINLIVPYGVKIPQGHITQQLEEAGCLRLVRPEDFLQYEDGVLFSKEFLNFLESPGFLGLAGRAKKFADVCTIHESKFGLESMSFLERKGLAKRGKGPWSIVPSEIGLFYMAWLAGAIAQKLHLHPVTDENKSHERLLLSQVVPPQGSTAAAHVSYQSIILDRVLPVPKKPIPLEKLLKFRSDHKRDLLSFTHWVAKAADELKKIKDKKEIEAKLSLLNTQLEEQKLSIKERFHENNIETKLSSLEALVDFKATDIPLVTMGTTVGTLLGGPLGGALGLGIAKFGVAGIKFYIRRCTGSIKEHSILREYPGAYVFNVEKHL